MNNIQRYKKVLIDWYATADKYSDDGAADSEPRWELADVVASYVNEGKELLPRSPQQWQLYTSEKPCKRAANALNRAAEKILDTLDKCTFQELAELKEYYGVGLV